MKNKKDSNAGGSNFTIVDSVNKAIHQKEEKEAGECAIKEMEFMEPPIFGQNELEIDHGLE